MAACATTSIYEQGKRRFARSDIIGKEQCKNLQSFIMSLETARDLGGLFELTTAR